jgi:glutaredoxin
MKKTIKLQFLHTPNCHICEAVKKILEEIKPDFPDLEIESIDATTPEGQKMVLKYRIMISPGIIINGELFSAGMVNKEKLIEKLKSLQRSVL